MRAKKKAKTPVLPVGELNFITALILVLFIVVLFIFLRTYNTSNTGNNTDSTLEIKSPAKKNFFNTMPLLVSNPVDGMVVTSDMLLVMGKTAGNTEVDINGRLVKSDKNGLFNDLVLLNPGRNIIRVKVEKWYLLRAQKELAVTYEVQP